MWKISFNITEIFKVTRAPFFIPDLNLMSCELDNFAFKLLYQVTIH